MLSISPVMVKEVKTCSTSKDIWLKLESVYASKGPSRKVAFMLVSEWTKETMSKNTWTNGLIQWINWETWA